jgi:uncharacterized protein GlcG (DUF336 family)
MRIAAAMLLLLPWTLPGQLSIATQVRNGVVRAVVLHGADLSAVSDDSPARSGENLVLTGSGFGGNLQVIVGGSFVDAAVVDDANAQFTLPAGAGGSFIGIAALSDGVWSNAATLPSDIPADLAQLSSSEVQALALNTASSAAGDRLAVVVVDRAGNILAIYTRPSAGEAEIEKALSLARTGAFFSNQATPLSSRTVRAISRVNFPEGIPNQAAGPLYGIENTNRGCGFNARFIPGQEVPTPLAADGVGYSQGIATVPGGLGLYRNGSIVIGGIGVAGLASDDADEYAAAKGAATSGYFVGLPLPAPGAVYVNGFQLPFINHVVKNSLGPAPPDVQAASAPGGSFQFPPRNGSAVPDGWLIGPQSGAALSSADVNTIVQNAVSTATLTRAAIRLPLNSRARMVISVVDTDGSILGLYRMPDSTIFSIDVAVTKARNVVYFSGPNRDARDLAGLPSNTAVTNRTIGFGAQIYFPSGIWNTAPGPFYQMYLDDLANPCTQGHQAPGPNQSGIVFFPGSSPLYRDGRLIGGLGVSGDGVDQDDFVTAGGANSFEAPPGIRADQFSIRGVRLPYLFFPRNPEQ